MSKNDFLEILRDYLKSDFSEYEINDIVRDYEEFFLNGELEGKSEGEIIKSLGSPKTIAYELVAEMKNKDNSNETNNKKVDFDKILNKGKAAYKTAKVKGKKILDSNKIVNGSTPGWLIILLLLALVIFVIPVIGGIAGVIIGAGIGMIVSTLAAVATWTFSLYTLSVNGELATFLIFMCIAGTGILIGAWTIYLNLVKLLKKIILTIISWFKTRFMYVKVKDKKDSMKEDNTENVENIEEDIIVDKEVEDNE